MVLRPDQHRSLFHKGRRRDLPVYVGALDAPAISMGSADAAGLAFLFRNRVGEHLYRCSHHGVSAKQMTKSEGIPKDEAQKTDDWGSCIAHSCFVIHSSFVTGHSSF